MTITSKFRTTVAAVAVAAGVMTVGLPAAPADAAVGSMKPNLRITPVQGQPGYKWVEVWGYVPMSQTEAADLIRSGHNVIIRLWGDDPASDDLLMGPYNPSVWANYDGLRFAIASKVPNSLLNEDWGEDDIYAGVRLIQPNTLTLRSAETNRVYGSF
jgi:hypothetical protein